MACGLETNCCDCERSCLRFCGENFSWDKNRSVGPCCDTCTVLHVCQCALHLSPSPLSPLRLFLLSPPFFLRVAASPHLDRNQQICVILLISAQARNPADYVDPGRGTKAFLSHEMVSPLDCCASEVKDKQSCWIVVSGWAQGSKMAEISTQIHQFLMTIKSHLKNNIYVCMYIVLHTVYLKCYPNINNYKVFFCPCKMLLVKVLIVSGTALIPSNNVLFCFVFDRKLFHLTWPLLPSYQLGSSWCSPSWAEALLVSTVGHI